MSNKVARVLLQHSNIDEGDTVAVFLGNHPFFLWIWLGLVKIGCSAAFLNYNMRSRSLLHCFSCSGANVLIVAEELKEAVEEILPTLREQNVTVFILTDQCTTAAMESFTDKISQASPEPIPAKMRSKVTLMSPAAYIYTSGTTGLPKAAMLTHMKLQAVSFSHSSFGVSSSDVFYINLPLYHSAGFFAFVGTIERGEAGLLVTRITQMTPFNGYVRDVKQTEKKRLHDVFVKGDQYFNTGDLLWIDGENFLHFKDRVGDTFRWKGENVSTNEVSDILTMVHGIQEANVYGVKVPSQEGRAGMAAIRLKEGEPFDGTGTCRHVSSYLPAYARPRFIRIQESLAITGTFKHMKLRLVGEGFNPGGISDRLYLLDEKTKNYVPLTQGMYDSIVLGIVKV
uniref:long-chain-fatty-acid--CoA ligase n=1 Tax=Esox lucius TaxID=8010 RepID=A0AAY5KTX9_ESOLU